MMVTLLGGVPIPYSLHRSLNWCPDPDEVSKLCGDKTKGIIITSPSNPCGSVMPMETLSSLARLSSTKGLLVISDEIYSRVYYGEGLRAPGLLQVDCMDLDPERLVVVDGVSKYWAMTGFRVGWVLTPNNLISATLGKVLESTISCGVPFAQAAATAALTDPSALLEAEKMTRNFKKRRDAAIRVVREFGLYEYTPQGAFYMLIKATDGDDMEFCKRLLQEERVAVSPGSAFGDVAKGFVRISLASSLKDVENGVKKLCQTILNSR
uniref:Aminotransferase class I/classII large domain-containing protein n=1 Tax=Amorphochlora amoebiformis TaxID=1561963 RepID=A0A7S0GMQ9_9EUKA|mmetsp:Transcript_1098/g.1532  ORF Transcript_1098/g.1532 Transcript_1098/m.1532 type:complete len:266 (+) Transcript_1098:430-1227(+)